jgi:hypothetical protein
VAADASWRHASEVPGLESLNAGGDADLGALSCAAAGSSAAGGSYQFGSGQFQAFVVSERNGRWTKAIEVPGWGALNAGGDAAIKSLSCPSVATAQLAGSTPPGRALGWQGPLRVIRVSSGMSVACR